MKQRHHKFWMKNTGVVRFDRKTDYFIIIKNPIISMTIRKPCLIAFLIGISLFWNSPLSAADQKTTITEDECTRLQGSEIIWHLSEYRWLCCIPKNEAEYEACIPISDREPLPKTSLKPFPPNTGKTIKPEKK
jgi:hypothetical protein